MLNCWLFGHKWDTFEMTMDGSSMSYLYCQRCAHEVGKDAAFKAFNAALERVRAAEMMEAGRGS